MLFYGTKDEDIGTVLFDILFTFLCSISSDFFPVSSFQLVHTIDSKDLQNCHGPNQTFALQEYFGDRTLDFILSHGSLSGDDFLEIISTYVSAKL